MSSTRPVPAHTGIVAWFTRWPDNLRAFAVLLGCVLLAWWPLATFTHCVVHGDMLDCWLPWRTFIADCLQNGEWPVWNPYQQMGYPVHADLQGPAWYPEALLLGATIGQSIYVLQGLVIVYLLVAGMGMYRLAKQFCGSHHAALSVALAYMLSGFFTAHVMHQYSFISGAWWPWMFAAFLRMLEKPHWRPALEAAVFQFLLLTGGNHTFTLIGFYLMLALIVVRAVQLARKDGARGALHLLPPLVLFAVAALIMSCGVLHAAWYSAPYIERMSGMDYSQAAQNPFTWRAALSLLIPWASSTDAATLGTDITMANGHIGMLLLLFLPLAFLRERTATENVLLAFGAVSLLASFGDALPVHRWLYSALPGLDVFRFPSYYTYFTMVCWLLPVSRTLAQWNGSSARSRTVLWLTTAVAAAVLLIAVVRAASDQIGLGFALDDAHESLFERMNAAGIAERALVHGSIQLALLAAFGFMLWRKRLSTVRLVAFVAAEGIVAVLLCSWQTGISDTTPSIIHRIVEMRPKGWPVPLNDPLTVNKDDEKDLQPLWRNTNIFQKRISHDGFNSYWPKDPHAFVSAALSALLTPPLASFHEDFVPNDDRAQPRVLAILQHGQAHFSIRVNTYQDTWFTFQQNSLPGWHASIDGNATKLIDATSGPGLMMPVKSGSHWIDLEYSVPALTWLRMISWAVFLLAVVLLSWTSTVRGARTPGLIGVSTMAVIVLFALPPRPVTAQPQNRNQGRCPTAPVRKTLYEATYTDSTYVLPKLIVPIAQHGAMVLRRDSTPWSPAYEVYTDQLPASDDDALLVQATFELAFEQDTSGSLLFPTEAFMVVSVEDEQGTSFFRTKPLHRRLAGPDGWSSLCFVVQAEELRRKRGKLKAYAWNNGPGTVLLHELKVGVLPWTTLGLTY